MINLNPNINISQNNFDEILKNNSIKNANNPNSAGMLESGKTDQKTNFSDTLKTIDSYLSDVDGQQQSADVSIKELLSSSNADITSVVSEVAKADVSFKLLVGVRNKLIEAYKQTMNMPL
jgi:flagellar hook-basal body complex protein FliE